jgi:hypothetical protein
MEVPPNLRSASSYQRSFGLLWAAVDLSAMGGWLLLCALAAWSYDGRESASTTGIVLLAWFFPAFALRPIANAIVNRRNGKPIAVLSLLVRAVALLPLLNAGGNEVTSNLFLALLLSSAALPFAEASFGPLLRSLMVGRQLAAAESAMGNGRLFAMIAGGAAAAGIYLTGQLQLAVPIGIAAIALSAALLLLAGFPKAGGDKESGRSGGPVTLQRGLLLAFRHPSLQGASAVKVIAALATGGLLIPQVAYMVWGLFTSPGYIGLVVAGQGAGMLMTQAAGKSLAGRYPRNAVAAVALLLMAGGTFAFTMTRTIEIAMAFGLVIGIGIGLFATRLSNLQSGQPEGTAPAADAGVAWAAEAAALLSIIAVGPLTDALAPRLALAIPAVILATLSLFAFGAVVDSEESSGPVYNGEVAAVPAISNLEAES